jgi:secreted PhoX family phosphatase
VPHDDIENVGSNPSRAPHLDQVVAARYSRRAVLTGGTAAAAVGFFAGTPLAGLAPAAAAPKTPRGKGPEIGFTAVPTSTADAFTVPPEYTAQVLVPWGTPLFSGVSWQKDASNTAAEQERQVGFNHDGMHYFPLSNGAAGSRRGLLVLNHEYTDANQIYTAAQGSAITPDAAGREKVAKALAGHGVTVVEVVQRPDGSWTHVVDSPYNRRVTGTTPVTFSGPVSAGHPALASNNAPMGTLNNCAHGYTPWGTYLACEENWNGYFGTAEPGWTPTPEQARYGVSAAGFGYSWHVAEPRFDLAKNPKELNRFGWVVEIDPTKPGSTPVKRTALGRIKHESATVTESKGGRVVVYTGDDENLDYVYKFVGNGPWRQARARGGSPLDDGVLYVARFEEDGTGTWLPLVHGRGPLNAANGFADQAEVLLRTREAADALGATPLHRPEWVAVDERTKDVYLTLTNGSGYTKAGQDPEVANPEVNSERNPNPYGHVLRWRERGQDNAATRFAWDIFTLAGDPAYDERVRGLDGDSIFGSPDGIWVDDDGRVWIQTDISNGSQNRAAVGYDNIGNNAMLVAHPVTREVRRFLVGPRGCEITGVVTTPDQRTMFVNVQHPGESTTYWNQLNGAPSTSDPRTVSNWPEFDPAGRPRPATVVIRRKDGGVIGT